MNRGFLCIAYAMLCHSVAYTATIHRFTRTSVLELGKATLSQILLPNKKVAGFAASICYAANGKAYGYIDIPGYYKPGETGHGAIASRAVVFDLYNQKMKKIEGLDLSNGYGVLVSKYKDGLAIANASTTTKGIYYLNPQTDKINPIPMITTIGNPMAIEWFGN